MTIGNSVFFCNVLNYLIVSEEFIIIIIMMMISNRIKPFLFLCLYKNKIGASCVSPFRTWAVTTTAYIWAQYWGNITASTWAVTTTSYIWAQYWGNITASTWAVTTTSYIWAQYWGNITASSEF